MNIDNVKFVQLFDRGIFIVPETPIYSYLLINGNIEKVNYDYLVLNKYISNRKTILFLNPRNLNCNTMAIFNNKLVNVGLRIDDIAADKHNFINGVAMVRKGTDVNFINKEFKFLSNEWFKDGESFIRNGCGIVQRYNNKWNFIRNDGTFASDEWFDCITPYVNGFARVFRDGKVNFIKNDGRSYVSKEWFDTAENFYNGFAKVWIGQEIRYIDSNGKLHKTRILKK